MKKYSTNTLSASDGLVPWLAAKGPLAYTPENPPDRDYYFQYGWVLPQVLAPDGDLKRHRYFGAWSKYAATEIFAFWNDARARRQVQVHVKCGRHGPMSALDV